MEMTQLTVHGSKHKRMRTQYGLVTFYEWLEKEKERIEAAPGRRAIIRKAHKTKEGRMYALWVDDIAGVNEPVYYK